MEAKKVVLIILTVLVLGPIVFVGSCFPIGAVGFGACFERSCSPFMSALIPLAFIIGISLAILVVIDTIRIILNPDRKFSLISKILLGLIIGIIAISLFLNNMLAGSITAIIISILFLISRLKEKPQENDSQSN